MACIFCAKRAAGTIVCFDCCARAVCRSHDVQHVLQSDTLPCDDDSLYIEMLNAARPPSRGNGVHNYRYYDLTDIFVDDVEGSIGPFLYREAAGPSDQAVTEAKRRMLADAYPRESEMYREHVLRITSATIGRLQRDGLSLYWKSVVVYACVRCKLGARMPPALSHLLTYAHVVNLEGVKVEAQSALSKVRSRASRKALQETLEASIACLPITLKTLNLPEGGVLQCPRCSKGPIYREACGDMEAHHGEAGGFSTSDNRCPNPRCRYFGRSAESDWDTWDGYVRVDPSSAFPTRRCNSVEDCEYLFRDPFPHGQPPPRPPCFPFDENGGGRCIDQFQAIDDPAQRRKTVVRTLLGTLKKRRREDERASLIENIVHQCLVIATAVQIAIGEAKDEDDSLEYERHTGYSDLLSSFNARAGSAVDWLRENAAAYDFCIERASHDMGVYDDVTGLLNYESEGFVNFHYLLQDKSRLTGEYAPESFDAFPVYAQELLGAAVDHLQYTWNVLED